jgi:hypothetical protein
LAERVQKFADEKRKLSDGVSHLDSQFSRLAALRDDIETLFANFDRALDVLGAPAGEDDADADARANELSDFIKSTQVRFDDVERRVVAFGALRTKLADLQSRLVPLEAADGGVVDLLREVQSSRDRIVAKIALIEDGGNGDLAARVKTFTEAKNELEERVSAVTEHFSKLATVRKELAGLFEKLSGAATSN